MTAEAELWALNAKGQEMWLCGRKRCNKDFSEDVPPKQKAVK